MNNDIDKQKIQDRVKAFCDKKQFTNPFVCECVSDFVQGHTELFGDIVSAEELFARLEKNVDKITFAGFEQSQYGETGAYIGRMADHHDVNEVVLYSSESELEMSELDRKYWDIYTEKSRQEVLTEVSKRRADIKSTLMHELTHAAYTIKDPSGLGEKHMFAETFTDPVSGKYKAYGTNTRYVEGITNYISTKIAGVTVDKTTSYPGETKAVAMLAGKIGEKGIIKAAWNSNEEQFKQSYIAALGVERVTGERSYQEFGNGMVMLRGAMKHGKSGQEEKQILDNMQQILDGTRDKLNEWHERPDGNHERPSISAIQPIEFDKTGNEPINSQNAAQKMANFFTKHPSLMKLSIVKTFVDKQNYRLMPANSQGETGLSKKSNPFIEKLEACVKPITPETLKEMEALSAPTRKIESPEIGVIK